MSTPEDSTPEVDEVDGAGKGEVGRDAEDAARKAARDGDTANRPADGDDSGDEPKLDEVNGEPIPAA